MFLEHHSPPILPLYRGQYSNAKILFPSPHHMHVSCPSLTDPMHNTINSLTSQAWLHLLSSLHKVLLFQKAGCQAGSACQSLTLLLSPQVSSARGAKISADLPSETNLLMAHPAAATGLFWGQLLLGMGPPQAAESHHSTWSFFPQWRKATALRVAIRYNYT